MIKKYWQNKNIVYNKNIENKNIKNYKKGKTFMKKKTAVVFGTFAPLHQGHIDLIQRAKRQCDQVWVVVSGYEGDRGEQVGLSLQKRFRYIREAFRDDELTSVCKLDETHLARYPMGWQEGLDQMLAEISYDET